MMMTKDEKEVFIFHEFAAIADVPILLETIKHGARSEPDIKCKVAGEGMVGFELTELVDSRFMARRDLTAKTRRSLSDYCEKRLPLAQRESFKTKYRNAILLFQFGAGFSDRKRQAIFGPIFEALLNLPDGFVGNALKRTFLPRLEWVKIGRGSSVGPGIQVSPFGWLGDPTPDAIKNKLAKSYRWDYPLELVVCND